MSMLDFDGSVKYVWNPFSLLQLKTMLSSSNEHGGGDFDQYLNCVATVNDATCIAPSNEIFNRQQISLLSVYQRCLSNYQEMTWDQGTYVLFNKTLRDSLNLGIPDDITDQFNVAKCLLEQRANGYDNVGCMEDYFQQGQSSIDYFEYGKINVDNPSSDVIDACLTFSGPAGIPNSSISAPFQACLETYTNRTGCDIPHMLWSGRSTNKVPVATQHAMLIADVTQRKAWAQNMMDTEKANVINAINKLQKWDGNNLRISIFSAEGNILLLLLLNVLLLCSDFSVSTY